MTEELAKSRDAIAALTEYAEKMHNQQFRAYVDALWDASPPAPPPSILRRLRHRAENCRERIADNVRRAADWIDPWA